MKKRYKKTCGICGKKKLVVEGSPESKFGFRRRKSADGTTKLYVKYMCRACEAEKTKEWREKLPAKKLQKSRRKWNKTRKKKDARTVFVPAGPLVKWLEELGDTQQLADEFHRKERANEMRVRYEYKIGHITWIRLTTADKILVAHDRTDLMARLWTEDELSGKAYYRMHAESLSASE